MATKQRIERLEKAVGAQSGKHFVPVLAEKGQTKEEAFLAALLARGIRREDVGQIFFLGDDFGNETVDFGGYGDPNDLIGGTEFWRRVLQITATSWKSSIRKIIKKRREMEAEGRLEEFYREMRPTQPAS